MKRLALTTLSVLTLGLTLASGANAIKPLSFAGLTNTNTAESVQLAQATSAFVTVDQAKATTGTAQVITENGQDYIVFDEAFDTARGPDVTVVLYDGTQAPVNLPENSYEVIGNLQSFEGGQRYLIPAELDVEEYGSVVIWCREFNVTFGYAAL
ncbi:MAG: DM13 domain-containing protein [Cyanobacteria bacterium P01_H01_bin.58]